MFLNVLALSTVSILLISPQALSEDEIAALEKRIVTLENLIEYEEKWVCSSFCFVRGGLSGPASLEIKMGVGSTQRQAARNIDCGSSRLLKRKSSRVFVDAIDQIGDVSIELDLKSLGAREPSCVQIGGARARSSSHWSGTGVRD